MFTFLRSTDKKDKLDPKENLHDILWWICLVFVSQNEDIFFSLQIVVFDILTFCSEINSRGAMLLSLD